MSNVVNEAVSGIQDVQSYAGFYFEEGRLRSYIDKLYSTLKRLYLIKYGIKFTDNLFQSFSPLILFLVGGLLIIKGQFTLGALVAFLSAYEKIYDPWKEMLGFYQSYQDAQVRYRQIMKIFDLQPPHALMPPEYIPLKTTGRLDLKNVDYILPNSTRLLNRITLNIQPGEQVAVVGFSGSGKSTLALLIDQLYDVSCGSILLDGHDISLMTKADISNNITMISQKPFVFSGTILDNLLYGLKSSHMNNEQFPSRPQLFQLLRDVGLEEDVLWFGVNSVLSKEQAKKYKNDFLDMRRIVHTELGDEFDKVVEFYDMNKFLYYATIRDNIIFGDSIDGTFREEKLLQNTAFTELLTKNTLEEDLVRLGLELARVTIEEIQHMSEHLDQEFFHKKPMNIDEVEI